ncbi:hypothetical protein RDV78_10200 [Bacillota bacterium LX-D]|nr:hypothetical protein [Bacillota bacterium LX-D]
MLEVFFYFLLCYFVGMLSFFNIAYYYLSLMKKNSLKKHSSKLFSLILNLGIELTFLIFILEIIKGVLIIWLGSILVKANTLLQVSMIFTAMGYIFTKNKNLTSITSGLIGQMLVLIPCFIQIYLACCLSGFLLIKNKDKFKLFNLAVLPASAAVVSTDIKLLLINLIAVLIILYFKSFRSKVEDNDVIIYHNFSS